MENLVQLNNVNKLTGIPKMVVPASSHDLQMSWQINCRSKPCELALSLFPPPTSLLPSQFPPQVSAVVFGTMLLRFFSKACQAVFKQASHNELNWTRLVGHVRIHDQSLGCSHIFCVSFTFSDFFSRMQIFALIQCQYSHQEHTLKTFFLSTIIGRH